MRRKYFYSSKRLNYHFLHRLSAIFLLISMTLCGCAKEPAGEPSEAVSTEPETS